MLPDLNEMVFFHDAAGTKAYRTLQPQRPREGAQVEALLGLGNAQSKNPTRISR